jgi:hypothetical protein
MSRSLVASLLGAGLLVGALGAPSALAMDMVSGGYGADVESYAPNADLAMRSGAFASSAGGSGLTLEFTPRASGLLFSRPTARADAPDLSFSFDFQGSYGRELRFDSIGLSSAGTEAGSGSGEGLALGGALRYDDWQLSGSLGRANLLGNSADVVAAGIGYGPLNARLVYGSVPETTGGTEGDLLMFSTDLAAWSWLTLQGDVAVSDTLADEPLTIGRVGIRLNF